MSPGSEKGDSGSLSLIESSPGGKGAEHFLCSWQSRSVSHTLTRGRKLSQKGLETQQELGSRGVTPLLFVEQEGLVASNHLKKSTPILQITPLLTIVASFSFLAGLGLGILIT